MAAILTDIAPGDEVIMPSYTFVSTANAFVLRGAKIVFVDVRPDTMNLDEGLIEPALTERTKAIVVVHYAGVACDMDVVMAIASRYGLFVIEDAAQAMMSTYKGRPLGAIGHLGAFSFHETKNYTSAGEGGLLLVNDERFVERAEIVREKGTNRSQFSRGLVDNYTWIDIGSSYLLNDFSAAFLWGQLEDADKIHNRRLNIFSRYRSALQSLAEANMLAVPCVPEYAGPNGHMFFVKTQSAAKRSRLIDFLAGYGIMAPFHYIPLHSSPAGRVHGMMAGSDLFTTSESEKLLRLPLFYSLDDDDVDYISAKVIEFYADGVE
jgi:dTDP-4-amino-4,6-dideoxygalactose transaminase